MLIIDNNNICVDNYWCATDNNQAINVVTVSSYFVNIKLSNDYILDENVVYLLSEVPGLKKIQNLSVNVIYLGTDSHYWVHDPRWWQLDVSSMSWATMCLCIGWLGQNTKGF